MKPTVKLTAYNTNFDSVSDWESWASFVADNIDETCGFEVAVDTYPFSRGPSKDDVSADTDEQEETIKEALRRLWDDWCAGDA